MLLLCLDASPYHTRLTQDKIYSGDVLSEAEAPLQGWWVIKKCDDGEVGMFQPYRFRELSLSEVGVEWIP